VPATFTSPTSAASLCEPIVLQARRGWCRVDLAELWRYRDLLGLLALRDIQIRYKQTALGAAWAVIQPLVTMVVLNVFFGRLMGVADRVEGAGYPIFLFAGLLPWTLFASSTSACANSLVANGHIMTKVYFPRLVVPLSAVGAPLLDYVIGLVVLYGLMIWYGTAITAKLVLIPLLVGSTLIAVLGVGVLLASLTVSYRDFRHVVPFLIQTLFFLTPVIYPITIVPQAWRWVLSLNPMGGTIQAFRAAILNTPIDYGAWGLSTAIGAAALVAGLAYFQRAERQFADVV